jgi:FixJ family two-component response regulator
MPILDHLADPPNKVAIAVSRSHAPIAGSYEIAEHATDDALTPAKISVLRLIAAGNANKQIPDQLKITGNRRESSQGHPFQVGGQQSSARRNDRH